MTERRRSTFTLIVCVALALLSYAMSISAIATKSPTADEPLHFASAHARIYLHDFRADPEDPPLWSWLAMASVPRDSMSGMSETSKSWPALLDDLRQVTSWVDEVIAQQPQPPRGENALVLMSRARRVMALLAPLLVLISAAAAWKLGGRAAAIVTATLIAFDPLILGHASLVKNDAAVTLATLVLAISTVWVMQRITWVRLVAFAFAGGAIVTTKFTGIPLLGFAIIALLARALVPIGWDCPVARRTLRTRSARLLASAAASLAIMLIVSGCIWAAYGFRYAATPDGRVFNADWLKWEAANTELASQLGRNATDAELRAFKPGRMTRVVLAIDHAHLLPNAFTSGFLHTYAMSRLRGGYLMGEKRDLGWWYYFPLAMLFKTPTATIAATGIAAGVALRELRRRSGRARIPRNASVALAVFGGGYLLLAMTQRLNLGVRHMMPIYPLIYIAVGVVFAGLLARRGRAERFVTAALAIGLVLESALVWPNYIAFFNAPSGGSRGGIRLLADSNLDWGQDLPLLVDWQARHPATKLYLSYFGGIDPHLYALEYEEITTPHLLPNGPPRVSGVIALSATRLQGIYIDPRVARLLERYRRIQPREVLGGTIYLFDYPPPAMQLTPEP